MALKPLRYTIDDTIDFFWGATAADRGGVASIVTVGSGEALDNSNAVVGYVAGLVSDALGDSAGSGLVPLGVLMNDVVSIDQTRQHLNQYKDEVQVNSKVTLMKRGVVNTNMILGTPTAGHKAYLGASGYFTATQTRNEAPIVGRFLSTKDHNGYAKIHVDLPNMGTPLPLVVAD